MKLSNIKCKSYPLFVVIISLFLLNSIAYGKSNEANFSGTIIISGQILGVTLHIEKPSPAEVEIFKGRKDIKGYFFKLIEYPKTGFFVEEDYGDKFGFRDLSRIPNSPFSPKGDRVEISGIEMGKDYLELGKNYYYVKLMKKIK